MSSPRPPDLRRAALGEIVRLAREDRRRGVRAWHDPALAADLRDLVREIDAAPPAASAGAGRPRRSAGPARPSAPPSIPAPPSRMPSAPAPSPIPAASTPARPRPQWGPAPLATGRDPGWEDRLEQLRQEASACTACGLCRTRSTVVFGTGSARVPLVFAGEAPGQDEDRQGVPFVGRAGQLLTRIIESIGLQRDEVYIANVLKCRPPENRNPAPAEIAACRHFLDTQLEILRPKIVCTLGLFASQLLLDSTAPIGKLRGRVFPKDGYRILPTYHPAALLRNPTLKATVWEDMQLLRRLLDE